MVHAGKSKLLNSLFILLKENQNSPVPVVVVRHPDKRQKKMDKRKNDPNRKGYAAILNKSASLPGSEPTTTMKGGKIIEAEAGEAEAVAKALGLTSNLANWKGFGFKKDDTGIVTVVEGGTTPAANAEENKQKERGNINDQKEEEEEGQDDESEDSGNESPTGAMYTESGGIETMPNFVGEPDNALDDDIERLALSDDDDNGDDEDRGTTTKRKTLS